MKKKFAWPFIVALITWVSASCSQNAVVEPEHSFNVEGLYHATYAAPGDDMPHTNINLDVKRVTDSTFQARMAFYHYYKDNLLFAKVTNACEPVISNDTLLLDLILSEGKKTGRAKPAEHHLNVKLRYDSDNMKLLSSSDGDLLPGGQLLFHKALTREDSTAIRFDARLPRTTMIEGMYYINGPIKKFSASSSAGAHPFEYYFNENGVVTGYKDANGKMYDYEVGEIDEGVYYSLLTRSGWKTELSYNSSQQLVSENTKRNLISYYYDAHGRLTEGYFKNSSTFYSFDLECDARGTLVGIKNKTSNRYEKKFVIQKTDNYGNPLELIIDYGNGRTSAPYHYEYEYYQ